MLMAIMAQMMTALFNVEDDDNVDDDDNFFDDHDDGGGGGDNDDNYNHAYEGDFDNASPTLIYPLDELLIPDSN